MVEKYHEAMDNFFYLEIYNQILSDWILNDYYQNLSKSVFQPSSVSTNSATKFLRTTRCYCYSCYRLKKYSSDFYKCHPHDDSCSKWCNTLAMSCSQNHISLLKPIIPLSPLHTKSSLGMMSLNKESIQLKHSSCVLCQFLLKKCTRPFFHRWKKILSYILFEFFPIHIVSNPSEGMTNAITQLFFHYLLLIYSIQLFLLFTGMLSTFISVLRFYVI
jgi:hypothetical protein